MLYRKPRVGAEIEAYCGTCKEERTHTIMAMDGDIVRRVTCSMCGGTHNFKRKEAAATAATGASSDAPKTKRATSSRRTKEGQAFSIDMSRPQKAYDMNHNYSAGDIISHPKFGPGLVETSLPPNKIEVRFQEGKKMLLHNMKNRRA
jgi:hypothetical protein